MNLINKLIIVLLTFLSLANAYVEKPRETNSIFQLALPRYENLGNTSFLVPDAEGFIEIPLSNDHVIHFAGKKYDYITVYPDHRIGLGEKQSDLDLGLVPYIKFSEANFSYVDPNLNNNWRIQFVALDTDNDEKNETFYTVLEAANLHFIRYKQGGYDSYQCRFQIVFYPDGEIQQQLWFEDYYFSTNQHPSAIIHMPEYSTSYFYDGVRLNKVISNRNPQKIYDRKKGLRSGWIAKEFLGYDVNVEEKTTNEERFLRIDFSGKEKYEGALLAYDYSRENPVVGGIERISIYSKNSKRDDPVYVWYFTETIDVVHANYPSLYGVHASDQKKDEEPLYFCNYSSSNYTLSWNEASKNDNIYMQRADLLPAPAIKFQKINPVQQIIDIYDIEYSLRQLASVQYFPPKPYELTFKTENNGVVRVDGYPNKSSYQFYSNQMISGSIKANVGKEVSKIVINDIVVFEKGDFYTTSDLNNPLYFYSRMLIPQKKDFYEKIDFKTTLNESVVVEVSFSECKVRSLVGIQPGHVKTEYFLDSPVNDKARKRTSWSIIDGLGSVVQIQDSLSPNKYLIKSTYLDGYGKTRYQGLSFVRDTSAFGYLDMSCYNCITRSNAYFDGSDPLNRKNAFGHAYAEEDYRYGNNDGSIGVSAGVGETSFSLSEDYAEKWVLPAESREDFIIQELLAPDYIQKMYRYRLSLINNQEVSYAYQLIITKDSEGKYQQTIINERGQIESSWIYDGIEPIIRYNEYNSVTGLLMKSYPATRPEMTTIYSYDALGRVIAVKDPDRGIIETRYDSFGRVRSVRSAQQKEKNAFTVSVYDFLGRLIAVGEVSDNTYSFDASEDIPLSDISLRIQTIYGKPETDDLLSLNLTSDRNLLNNILEKMEGITKNDAGDIIEKREGINENDIGAVIAYDNNGKAVSLKMSSYDRLGRKKYQWVIYKVDIPAVELSYSYNLSDELVNSNFNEWNGSSWSTRSSRSRSYDNYGNLIQTKSDGTLLAKYNRNDIGSLESADYYDQGSLVFTKSVVSDIYGRPLSLDYKKDENSIYSQSVSYTKPGSGKLESSNHEWNNVSSFGKMTHSTNYEYDVLNRLVQASGDLEGEYAYDNLGRLKKKNEGEQLLYMYDAPRYASTGISLNSVRPVQYFQYDASGNIWLDSYKKVTYDLNNLGLPETIRLYAEIPSEITYSDVENGTAFDKEFAHISMAYDESGTRIWQTYSGKNKSYNSEATVQGVGVYSRTTKDSDYQLTRLDLIGGGYRDGLSGVAYFPVKDVQGNIRGYVNKEGLQSAYGYYPYGTVEELVETSNLESKRWQGKEYDGEHGKYYFGARYFDPFFGMWMSPDPAGQFSNPYTYGGDPLNYVDPNGEWAHVVVGAIIGGAIGVYSGYRQCNGSNDADCGKKMLFNGLMGAGVGAATAATGGAISGFGGTATGAVGLKFGGTAAAITGAGIEGAMIGAAGGAVSYAGTGLVSMANTGSFDWNPRDLVSSMGYGAASGFVTGALTGAISYNISDEYAAGVDFKVGDYAIENGRNEEYMKYVAKRLGIDPNKVDYFEDFHLLRNKNSNDILNAEGGYSGSNYESTTSSGTEYKHKPGHIVLGEKAFSDPSNVFETMSHEYGHVLNDGLSLTDDQEHWLIYQRLKLERYYEFYSPEVKLKIEENIKNLEGKKVW